MKKFSLIILVLIAACSSPKERAHKKMIEALEHLQYGKFDEAIPLLEDVIELEPQNAEAWYNLGNCYFGKHNEDKAMECFDKAIEVNPSYALSYVNRGKIFKLRKERDKACADFLMAESLGITYLKEETKFCKDPSQDNGFSEGNSSFIKDSLSQ